MSGQQNLQDAAETTPTYQMDGCRMLAGVGEGGGDKHHSLFSELPDPQMHTQGQISISPTRPPPTVTHTRQKPPKLPLIPSAKRHQCVY